MHEVLNPATGHLWVANTTTVFHFEGNVTDDLLAVLLSWAVTLSGYPAPSQPPEVVKVPHAFFVECLWRQECKVYGWYAGGKNLPG
jgi:hypothetical protein